MLLVGLQLLRSDSATQMVIVDLQDHAHASHAEDVPLAVALVHWWRTALFPGQKGEEVFAVWLGEIHLRGGKPLWPRVERFHYHLGGRIVAPLDEYSSLPLPSVLQQHVQGSVVEVPGFDDGDAIAFP